MSDELERLKKEVGESVDAMNRAAAKIGEQSTALNDAKAQLADAQTKLAEAQAAAAAGNAVDEATLKGLSDSLDAAQGAVDTAINATAGVQDALNTGGGGGEQPAG